MMEVSFRWFEAAVLLVWLSCTETYGTDVKIRSSSDCDRSFDLDDHSEVNVHFYHKTSSDSCQITVKEHSSDDYPRMCIKPERLDFNGCSLKVEVHKGLVIDGYEDEEYSCSNKPTQEICTYLSSITVIFKRRSSLRVNPVDIWLRIYPAESEFKSDPVVDTPFAVLMGILGGAAGLVIIISVAVCCCRGARQRARYRQQQGVGVTTQGGYPEVQYNTVPPQTGGFQPPPPQGYKPPPQGYQPPPQGYQPPPQQGYQPPPQGYQPPPQGYQPPTLQGYQPPPGQGYQPPPHDSQPPAGGYHFPLAHGYQPPPQDYRTHTHSGEDQSDDVQKPSAPPRDEDIPPPPYPGY